MPNFISDTQEVFEVDTQQSTVQARNTQNAFEVGLVQPVIFARMTQIVLEVKQGPAIASGFALPQFIKGGINRMAG